MRPEQFSSGNPRGLQWKLMSNTCFNEAGAIQLRKSLDAKAGRAYLVKLQ